MKLTKLTKLGDIIYTALSMHRLNKEFLAFSKAHLCFMVASNIQAVFVNILLIRQAGDPNTTIYYNMIAFMTSALSMLLAVRVAKHLGLKKVAYIGIGLYAIAYAIFLICMQDVVTYFIPIALLLGFGGGFFWFFYLNAISNYATDDNRDAALAFLGVVGSAIALSVPAIAGVVIGMFVDFTGYSLMFGVSFLSAGGSLYFFTKLPELTPSKQPTAYGKCLKNCLTHPAYRWITLSTVIRCIRDGIFAFFLNVLLFQFVSNEALIGFNSLWGGFVGIFAQYFAGRYLKPTNRMKTMTLAAVCLTLGVVFMYLDLSAWSILLCCTINAFFFIQYINPSTSIDYLVLQNLEDGIIHREEYLGFSEVFRAIGRNAGLVFLLLMPRSDFGYVTTLVVITVIQFGSIYALQQAQKEVEKRAEDAVL